MTPLRARAAHLARATLATPRHVHRADLPRVLRRTDTMELAAGQKYKGMPHDGCAKCMFNCFTCGTDFTFVVQSVDGDGEASSSAADAAAAKASADAEKADSAGWTALMRACQSGHVDCAEKLLDKLVKDAFDKYELPSAAERWKAIHNIV